jgi:hypothetical protein
VNKTWQISTYAYDLVIIYENIWKFRNRSLLYKI